VSFFPDDLGSRSLCGKIEVVDDFVLENAEKFNVSLNTFDLFVEFTQQSSPVNIDDNDGKEKFSETSTIVF